MKRTLYEVLVIVAVYDWGGHGVPVGHGHDDGAQAVKGVIGFLCFLSAALAIYAVAVVNGVGLN